MSIALLVAVGEPHDGFRDGDRKKFVLNFPATLNWQRADVERWANDAFPRVKYRVESIQQVEIPVVICEEFVSIDAAPVDEEDSDDVDIDVDEGELT